MRVLRVVEEV